MKHLKLYRFILLCLALTMVFEFKAIGDKKYTRNEYINQWKNVAIQNMKDYGIPASITLAQAILESGDGNSMLARQANNHFGIKCHGWNGKRVYKDDDKKNDCFRKYKHAMESFKDHSEFLQKNRYKSLYDLDPTDYKGWAKGLKKAGYATNPRYARLLINIIEKHKLFEYDNEPLLASAEKDKIQEVEKVEAVRIEGEEIVVEIDDFKRDINIHENNIKYVLAKQGEHIDDICSEFDLAPWQIKKYNNLEDNYSFKENEIVFIQPKRNKSKSSYHIVENGDHLEGLSQKYGVKVKKLAQYNGLSPGDQLLIGMKLWLQKPPPT